MYTTSALTVFTLVVSAAALAVKRAPSEDVHLAIGPKCGAITGPVADINEGLRPLSSYETIVTFGDSYSDNSESNGKTWTEYLAKSSGATLKTLAASGALVDAAQYVGSTPSAPDFFAQIGDFVQETPESQDKTLYTVFFGIEDFVKSNGFKTLDAQTVAGEVIYGILQLTSSPIFAKNILVVDNYGRGTSTPEGEAFKEEIFSTMKIIASRYKIKFAYADLSNLWNAVLGSDGPGHEAFGYTSAGACVNGREICSDPAHTFYYKDGIPSTATFKIVADYINQVIATC